MQLELKLEIEKELVDMNPRKIILAVFIFIVAVTSPVWLMKISAVSPKYVPEGQEKYIQVFYQDESGATIIEDRYAMLIGDKNKFVLIPNNIGYPEGVWKIANSAVAKVDQNGYVVGLTEGHTTLEFHSNDKKYNYKVPIDVYRKVTSFQQKEKKVTLHYGESFKPSFTTVPKDAKVITMLANKVNGQLVYDGMNGLELKQDGTVVAHSTGNYFVGFRYGADRATQEHEFVIDHANGYISSIEVRVVMDKSDLVNYVKDVTKFRDEALALLKADYDHKEWDLVLSDGDYFSKFEMDDAGFNVIKDNMKVVTADVEKYRNAVGTDNEVIQKRALQKTIAQLTTALERYGNGN
jgi:hypothetical protein